MSPIQRFALSLALCLSPLWAQANTGKTLLDVCEGTDVWQDSACQSYLSGHLFLLMHYTQKEWHGLYGWATDHVAKVNRGEAVEAFDPFIPTVFFRWPHAQFCVGNVRPGDLKPMWLKWARAHRETLDEPASSLIIRMLREDNPGQCEWPDWVTTALKEAIATND